MEASDISLPTINDDTLDQEDWPILGQGAGGITRKVEWKNNNDTAPVTLVAVKTFVGTLTSDGSPQDERAISVVASSTSTTTTIATSSPTTTTTTTSTAAASTPSNNKKSKLMNDNKNTSSNCLISLLGQTPKGALIMEYLDGYEALAGPPSMESCSRDVYSRTSLSTTQAKKIVTGLLRVLTNLHAKGICHGDFYGHNILIHEGATEEEFRVKLSDFGAAFFYDVTAPYAKWIEKIELRAFGVLVEELQSLLLVGIDDDEKEVNLLFAKLVKACQDDKITSFEDLGHLIIF